jgi:hypothetical protein
MTTLSSRVFAGPSGRGSVRTIVYGSHARVGLAQLALVRYPSLRVFPLF